MNSHIAIINIINIINILLKEDYVNLILWRRKLKFRPYMTTYCG